MIFMKNIKNFFFILFFFFSIANADENSNFENWKKNFKERALNNGISEKTFNKKADVAANDEVSMISLDSKSL